MNLLKKKTLKKLLAFACVSSILVTFFTGCSSKKAETKVNTTLLSKSEFEKMYPTNSGGYVGRKANFYAKVSNDPKSGDGRVYIQCEAENSLNMNTLVKVKSSNLDIKKDDVIHVVGHVIKSSGDDKSSDSMDGTPTIKATKVEKTDYATAFDPAVKTIQMNQDQNQNGFVITVQKVEVSKNVTRVYLGLSNTSNNTVSINTFESKLIQGSNQIDISEEQSMNYPQIQTQLMQGIKSQGVLVFKNVNLGGDNVKFTITASSQDYNVQFQPYQFDISLK
ncbi:hypothetical protein KYB31_21030 [Clostridium felsineum]|uniref:hypothetical protein n=1 Tax=Clostridium felsineum TaxID=36839 RepID=UPI00214D32A6|nr:hypothetical protein [Clostridium felsineum]MCR3761460.1 hypothetical protein [Clostridium felsineum]